MRFGTSSFKTIIAALALSVSMPAIVHAQSGQSADPVTVASYDPAKRAALLDLARDFVDVVDEGFKRADDYWFSLSGNDPDKQEYLSYFEDGEILLLQIKLPENTRLGGSVIAEKQGNDVMISLADFVALARFPISVNPANGTAEGWYIREDQDFMLDYPNRIARIKGEDYAIQDGDVKLTDNDVLIKGATLAKWFDFDLEVNARTQEAAIDPERKWPVQEQMEREKRKDAISRRRGPAELPRKEDPYKIAAIPYADVFLGQRLRRSARGDEIETTKSTRYTVRTTGDLAGHTGESIISGNDEHKLNSARFKLKKTSEDNDLLGPLQARSYEFGDISTTNIPLAGGSGSELGARVTNKNPYVTNNTFTPVTGYSVPGWDVELYRDQQFIAITTVGEDGQYRFDDVPLFAGENRFRVVQYGLQGEMEEEEFSLLVDPSIYNEGQGVYDVSVSLNNTQTYLKNKSEDEDRNTPHLSAQYEYQVAPDLSVRTGLKMRDEDGEGTVYVHGGAAANFDGVIVNADAVVDNNATYSASLTGRKSFKDHSITSFVNYASENYNISGTEDREDRLTVTAQVNGRLNALTNETFDQTRYDISGEYTRSGDDFNSYDAKTSLSTRVGRLRYNNALNYRVEDDADNVTKRLKGRTGIRGNFLKTNWRVTSAYDIYPEYEINQYEITAQKRINEDFSGLVKLEHRPIEDISEGEISATWKSDYVQLTPSVTYDTEENLQAFLNARFGLAYDPYSNKVKIDSDRLTGRGGVSARVYLDNDGDRAYSEGDELLEGVRIESVQSLRFAESDEDGIAFFTDLPTNRITDIVMNESSLPDPFWISGFEGASIRPRPGNVTSLDFPVHKSGEIDGTVYALTASGKKQPVKNVRINMYDEQGELHETSYAAFDGFYLFSRVPPGEYTLIVSAEDAKNQRFEPPPPQKVEIGYDGTIIYGNDIVGKSMENGVGFAMANLTDYIKQNPAADLSLLEGQDVILNLGEYNSRLLMALTWYHMRNRYSGILGNARLIVPPSESHAMAPDKKHTMRVKTDILNHEDARLICRSLMARGFTCGVELIPESFFTEISAGNAAQPSKS